MFLICVGRVIASIDACANVGFFIKHYYVKLYSVTEQILYYIFLFLNQNSDD